MKGVDLSDMILQIKRLLNYPLVFYVQKNFKKYIFKINKMTRKKQIR